MIYIIDAHHRISTDLKNIANNFLEKNKYTDITQEEYCKLSELNKKLNSFIEEYDEFVTAFLDIRNPEPEFLTEKIYTTLNADELKRNREQIQGFFANDLVTLKNNVFQNKKETLIGLKSASKDKRFVSNCGEYNLFYPAQ